MTPPAPVTLSPILDRAKPPSEWVALLGKRGISISERALREKANRIGACHRLGRAMIITPEQIDQILGSGQACHSNHIGGERPGGRAGASTISESPSPNIIAAALTHLRKQGRGDGARKKNSGGSVVTFSATKKR